MSGTSNPELEKYLRRDETWYGRMANAITDWNRDLQGKPSLWHQAIEYDAMEERIKAEQTRVAEHWETALAGSQLSANDKAHVRDLFAKFEHEFPGMDNGQMNHIIVGAIEFAQTRAESRQADNQMNLFTTAMLRDAQPLDLDRGRKMLEDLAVALDVAERSLTDDANRDTGVAMAAWDDVEDQMELIYGDRSALEVAKEIGLVQNEYGVLQTARGTALTSDELCANLEQAKVVEHDTGR